MAPVPSGPRHAATTGARHAASAAPAASAPAPAANVDLLDPLLDAPVTSAAGAARGPAMWPCTACGASNELEHDACTQCGTPFLAGAEPTPAIDLPLIGQIRPLDVSKSSRVWLMLGGGGFVCILLVVLLSLIGLFL